MLSAHQNVSKGHLYDTSTLKYLIPAFVCTVVIFYLSIISQSSLPQTLKDLFSIDKLLHAIAYGTLAGTYFWGVQKYLGYLTLPQMILIALGAAAYGVLMEVIQYTFFPERYFEVLDILANIMGIFISYLIYNLIHKTTAP